MFKKGIINLVLIMGFALLPIHGFALGDDVNNGSGVAERTILYAYSKLENYIRLCLNSDTCKLKSPEQELLNKILLALPEEYTTKDQIRFASEKESPGTFLIDGEIKAAKTGSKIGSPIYFNRDLFSAKTINNTFEPVSISNVVSLLIHELGHHHFTQFHEADLDLLGVKVAILLDQEIYQTPVFPNNRNINAIVINDKLKSFYPEVLLYVGDEVYDISKQFKDALSCPNPLIPAPLPEPNRPAGPIAIRSPKKVIFYNLHWESFSEENGVGVFQILGNLILNCSSENSDKSNQLKISFNVKMDNSKWKLVDQSIGVQQFYKPWWKIINLPFLETNF